MPAEDNVIVFPNNENGGVCVIFPAPSSQYSLVELGYRLVPAGLKFAIVPRSDIPSDNELWYTLEVDPSDTDGTGMTDEEWNEYLANKPKE